MSNDYIVQRRIKLQKLRRQVRRVEIGVIRLYKFVRFLFAILIIFCTYKFAHCHYWYLPSDIYTNKNTTALEIVGNSIVKNDKIISQMQRVPLQNKPLYKINTSKISNSIEELTPIKRVYVRRFWFPARIVLMVDEVKPVFTVSPSENAPSVAAFAQSGEIISKEYLPLSDKFNTIKILSYGTQGDDYKNWNKEKIDLLYKICSETKSYANEDVINIDLRQPNNVFIQLKSVKVRIGEIDSNVFERIKRLYDIMPKARTMKDDIKYIDLSWRDSIYLKLKK